MGNEMERLRNSTEALGAAFAKRLDQACDTSPHCPPKFAGRQTWLVQQMNSRGIPVGKQAVSKWFEGDSVPRANKMDVLAEVLGVDVSWLMLGTDTIEPKERRVRNAQADGAVNVLAGLIQMDGGAPAFPEEKDRRANREHIDLYAVIRGANYALHVTLGERDGDDVTFSVPATLGEDVLAIVMIREGLSLSIYEALPEHIAEHGSSRGGSSQVKIPATALRAVVGFDQRL